MYEIKRYARKNCATFGGREGCAVEGRCRYFRDQVKRCPYFELYVLPADPALEERYKRIFVNGDTEKWAASDTCDSCGEPIQKRSNRQKYCKVCTAKNKRQAARERMQRRRKTS